MGVDFIQPDWKMMEQFVLEKTQPALALDALSTSHPISVDVRDPKEIEAIFDTISYNKVKSFSFECCRVSCFIQILFVLISSFFLGSCHFVHDGVCVGTKQLETRIDGLSKRTQV